MAAVTTPSGFAKDNLNAFYLAERQLLKALRLMGRAADHVADAAEIREHAARLQRAFQAVVASAAGALTPARRVTPESLLSSHPHPGPSETEPPIDDRVKQYGNATLVSVETFAKSLGQDKVVEIFEEPSAKKIRRTRKHGWPGPLRKPARPPGLGF
ncbi:MAG: hypothetical protein JWM88_3030 [Verrucomicrobia bacterium]|nr:hypothetical protein [Verrucomicrobiota bacterium]